MPIGAGFQDAQGQWSFGELDDAGGLASDLLNLAQSRVSAGFASDRARLVPLETLAARFTEFTTYTPTLTNFSVGTGGSAQAFAQSRADRGMVEVHFRFVLGSSGASVSGIPTFTLPFTAKALDAPTVGYAGLTTLYDTSTGATFYADIGSASGSTSAVRILLRGNNGVIQAINGGNPLPWASTDILTGRFRYERA